MWLKDDFSPALRVSSAHKDGSIKTGGFSFYWLVNEQESNLLSFRGTFLLCLPLQRQQPRRVACVGQRSPRCVVKRGSVSSFDHLHTLLIIKVLLVVYNGSKGCNFLVSAVRLVFVLKGSWRRCFVQWHFSFFFFFLQDFIYNLIRAFKCRNYVNCPPLTGSAANVCPAGDE